MLTFLDAIPDWLPSLILFIIFAILINKHTNYYGRFVKYVDAWIPRNRYKMTLFRKGLKKWFFIMGFVSLPVFEIINKLFLE